jgi:hypothetical protein
MSDQPEPERDYSHIRFPDIPTAQADRDALNRKLSEIQAAFDERQRGRQADSQRVAREQQIQADADGGDAPTRPQEDPGSGASRD